VRFAYIRELKEAGILQIKWISGENNCADLFTKNLDKTTFERHAKIFYGSYCNQPAKEEE